MAKILNTFFEILRFAIGSGDIPIEKQTEEEWQTIYEMSEQQGLLGVMFQAVERLPKEMQPESDLLVQWYGDCLQLNILNEDLNRKAVQTTAFYEKYGFKTCILKGQGNALLYPIPQNRTPGDIDIWCLPAKKVLKFVRQRNPSGHALYHHIEAEPIGDVEVEVHYRPSFMKNFFHNQRLQRWFKEQSALQFSNHVSMLGGVGNINAPTSSFNRIFLLSHLYRHVIHEGIGLKQMLDYYYVLNQGFTKDENQVDIRLLKHFGLYDIAGAVMYVMREVFALEQQYLMVPVDERRGQFLLDEILRGGNFGIYDNRTQHDLGLIGRNMQILKRDLRYARCFPSECLWEPFFHLYDFFWRQSHN